MWKQDRSLLKDGNHIMPLTPLILELVQNVIPPHTHSQRLMLSKMCWVLQQMTSLPWLVQLLKVHCV